MAAEIAASERLNYLSKKARAVSSRHTRQILNAVDGNKFYCDGTTTIEIPGNQIATYMDFQNSYLRFTVQNDHVQHDYSEGGTNYSALGDIYLASGYDLIQRIEILADGQTLSNIQNYNVVVNQYLDSEVGEDYRKTLGSLISKTSQSVGHKDTLHFPQVSSLGVSSKETICLPLILTPFFNVNKYIPLVGRSNIQIRIHWARAIDAFSFEQYYVGIDDNKIVLSPVDFICSTVRLSAEANAMVIANTGGIFELITSDIRCAEGTHEMFESGSINMDCGFSFSSLDRISFSFYGKFNSQIPYATRCRSSGNIKNFALAINGEEYPRKRIDISSDNVAETVAELAIAHRALADFTHEANLFPDTFFQTNPTGVALADPDNPAARRTRNDPQNTGNLTVPADGTTGQFVAFLDTEAMQPHTGDSLYSGISTVGATVQLMAEAVTTNTTAVPLRLIAFAQFTISLSLDLQGDATWNLAL